MFWHGDAFYARIEALVAECPSTRELVASAVVEGVATDGAWRFHQLQQRLRLQLEEDQARRRLRLRAALLGALVAATLLAGALMIVRRR